MSEKIEGYSYQKHELTPDNPCEIKTMVCNDIEIPVEFLKHNFVTVDGKKYIELQQQNKKYKEVIDKIMNLIKKYGKYDGKKCTRGFQMWSADFNKILDILKEASK